LVLLLVWGMAGFASTAAVAAPAVTAQESTTTAPPEETTVPDDTSAPEEQPEDVTEEPAREPTSVPAWTWVVGLLILLAAIIWMVRGSGASSGDNTTGQ